MTNENSPTPNTLIKQGAELLADLENAGEELPSMWGRRLRQKALLHPTRGLKHLFCRIPFLRTEEAMVPEVLGSDESLQIDGFSSRSKPN